MPQNLKQALDAISLPKDAEWFGLREVRESTTLRDVRDGKPQLNDTTVSHGVMVEVLVDGQFGYAATAKLDPESLKMAAESAYRQAKSVASRSVFRFTSKQRPKITANYRSPRVKAIQSLSAGEINRLLLDIDQKLRVSPLIIRTDVGVRLVEMQTRFVSSNGSDGEQDFSIITLDYQATARKGDVIQTRSHGGPRGRSYQGGWEHFLTPDLWENVRKVGEESVELVHSELCPTMTADLLLKPDQMMLQIHESIGHPLELDRILGDERNYAGWSFVKPEDFGKLRYGSPMMNVTFDPTVSHELASYGFDDNGVEAKREFLIRDGILQRGLGGIESQARSGIPGVANARASSWNRAPIDRMANLNLEPGRSTWEEMVASVERGVMMEANVSWSIDDFRNKFQFGCEYAKLIEKGKLTKTVRNPNYRGVTVPFWNSLKMIGGKETAGAYGTPFCGKGEPNQLIRVGHASPACLFENIEIFGGSA